MAACRRASVAGPLLLWPALMCLTTACTSTPLASEADQTVKAQMFSARCSTCHALPHPKRHSYPEWQHLVAVMEQRMQERGMTPLDEQQRRDILTYLKLNGR